MKLSDLVNVFESLWPTGDAEEWDVVGLVSGSTSKEVKSILLTVDVTHEVVAEAKQMQVDIILSHHPLLLRGVNSVAEDTAKGSILSELIRADIALYTAHTNADSQVSGTSAMLAKALNLKNMSVLSKLPSGLGIGLIGDLPTTLGDLAMELNRILPPTASGVRVAGDYSRKVSRIALCAGAGDAYLQLALDSQADVYITSDLRHHPAQEILEQARAGGREFSLIDISHWAAEFLWLEQAKKELASTGLTISISDLRTDVFDFLVNAPRSQNAD